MKTKIKPKIKPQVDLTDKIKVTPPIQLTAINIPHDRWDDREQYLKELK